MAELTLRREWLTGHSCCQCRLAKQRDFTQFLRSGRALLQEACSEVHWQELWSEISGNHIEIIISYSVSQMWPVDSCLFSEFTDVFLYSHLWLVVLYRCTFTAWRFEVCSSPGTEVGAEAAETLLMARTEGKCLSIRRHLNKQLVILWLRLVLGNRQWCPLGNFTASGLLGLFAVNLKPKFV